MKEIIEDTKPLETQVSKPEEKPDNSSPKLASPVIPVPTAVGKENSPFCTPSNPYIMKHRQMSVSKAPLTPANRYSTLLTSTPACNNCLLTPSPMLASADDMSPITMSTQRMPKAMQVNADLNWTLCLAKFF